MKNCIHLMAASTLLLACCVSGQVAGADADAEAPAVAKEKETTMPRVKLSTTMGDIVLELNEEAAPLTVANFLRYVDDGFYDGTIFHRVISDFMVQGGGFTTAFVQKPVRASVRNEADNRLKNERGTVAMARTSEVHSATAQFFINVKDNAMLNYRAPNPQGYGYCVFGRVVEGMDVVDKIRAVATMTRGPHQDVPREDVVIQSAKRVVED